MMAEKQNFGGLPAALDLSKLPLYGASEEQVKELRDAQQQALTALEKRYEQPNWFKVAAGFAKPQLGGFLASIGSASEALGENIEQQRAQQLPIAQMRASLAQSNLLLGKNQEVNAKIEAWKRQHPGQMPSAAQVMEWRAESPQNPTVQSIAEQQKVSMEQQGQALQILRGQYDSGAITRAQYAEGLRALGQSTQLTAPFVTPGQPGAQPAAAAAATPPAAAVAPATSGERGGEEKKPAGFYPVSYVAPDVKDLPDWQATDVRESWKTNAANEEKRYRGYLDEYSKTATGPVYDTVNTAFKSAIDLIEKNPQMAGKVFNLLRGEGGLKNQILSSLQTGIGFNVGSTSANINLPVGTFLSSGLNPTEQQYADALVNAMLTVGNSKLLAQGISPGTGQQAYFSNLMTKASLDQNPSTALHILHKDRVNFEKNKKLYDTVIAEHNERKSDPNSLTPFTDIFRNSPQVRRIQAEAEERNAKHEQQYREMLEYQEKMRNKKP